MPDRMPDSVAVAGRGWFPATRWSAVVAARSPDAAERERALDVLLAAYWKPVYKYVRVRWGKSSEDAQDLTQDFFARLIEKNLLDGYDPARARLRTFLRACVDHLVANQARDERREKRGGGALHVSLDFQAADGELKHLDPAVPPEMDAFFEREWARSVFTTGVERLRAELARQNKSVYFRIFERYDLLDALPDGPKKRPTYQELAGELNLAASDVTNYLAYARREFRRIVLDFLREMTSSDEEFRREARSLLGAEPQLEAAPGLGAAPNSP
ncbi:MAG TPA: sigma-70 family RNA polymerase sigma factor [Candidatus Acidoferrales bacterium]|nr:sigma-70 family RNA polymerase sigma factor [Candidatus Acidoferrales bacterium]